MKLIIGLGNPGKNYEKTRHNIGFMFLDFLKKEFLFPDFSFDKKFNAEISEQVFNNEKILLVKPLTFMNLSGETVRKILDFYKITNQDIVVIQDELDLPLGKYKVATNSSSAGHNGIKNIIEHLGTQEFSRLRIGIGTQDHNASCLLGAHDFVLSNFTQNEAETLHRLFPELLKEIQKIHSM